MNDEEKTKWLEVPDWFDIALERAQTTDESQKLVGASASAIAWAKETHNRELFLRAWKAYIDARRKTTEIIISNNLVTSDDISFTKMQWSRRLKEYKVPAAVLDGYFDNCISNGWNPSIAGMLKEAYPGEGEPKEKKTIHDIARDYLATDGLKLSDTQKRAVFLFADWFVQNIGYWVKK